MRSAQPWIRVSLYTWEIRREDFVLMSKMKIERFKNGNRLADRGLTAPDVQAVPDFMDYDIKRQFLCLFHQLITDLRGLKCTVWDGFTFSQMNSRPHVSFFLQFLQVLIAQTKPIHKSMESRAADWLFSLLVDVLKINLHLLSL